jgi:DNA-binding MarR family transcriptional regulator
LSLLYKISVHKDCSIGDLAKILLMEQTTVTRNIALLRKIGYVGVEKMDGDARRKVLSITEKGAHKLREALPLWGRAQAEIEGGLGEKRFEDFLALMNELAKIVE